MKYLHKCIEMKLESSLSIFFWITKIIPLAVGFLLESMYY